MKTKLLFTMALALNLAATSACAQWGKRIKGNGDQTTEQRQVGSYDRISVSHIFKVELIPGEEGELRLEGESNLLEYVETEVSGGRLKITVERGLQLKPSKGSGGIRIRVPVQDLEAISISGAAELKGSAVFEFASFEVKASGASELELSVRSDRIDVQTSGASDIVLDGSTQRLEVECSGASHLKAFELEADNAEVRVSGAANARVRASNALMARASGAGTIRYKGNPEKMDSKATRAADVRKG